MRKLAKKEAELGMKIVAKDFTDGEKKAAVEKVVKVGGSSVARAGCKLVAIHPAQAG